MLPVLVTVLALTTAADTTAAPQTPPPPPEKPAAANEIFFEALGSGLLYSLNYERFVDILGGHHHLGFRGGASYFTWSISDHAGSGNITLLSFPLVASYYIVWNSHRLQLGAGTTFLDTIPPKDDAGQSFSTARSGFSVAFTAAIGYRYVPHDGGFTFGAAFTPLIRPGDFLPWGGADVGWIF